MELRSDDLAAYVALVAPGEPKALERLREKVRSGQRRLADIRVTSGLSAAVRVAPLGPRSAELLGPFGEGRAAAELVAEAIDHACESGVEVISARPRARALDDGYQAALLENGFAYLGERVEFKTPVDRLPLEDGSPLSLSDLDSIGIDAAAAVLGETAIGDPHGEAEREDPRRELDEWLADPVLNHGPECVHVGHEDGRAVAFVCAQVRPENGWSRITYMGVVPAARGRGFGRWAHRHGFSMIRTQGGTLYHGGTATDNAGMLRLFEVHGCVEVERMLEYEWRSGC